LLRVQAVRYQAEDVHSFELVDPDHRDLATFEAGAHVDLTLPNGLVRSYSLTNSPAESHRYVVGVHKAPNSRGGSSWIHEEMRPGSLVEVSEPRNTFALEESADVTVLIAGGIGITPLLAMARRLTGLGKPWQLYYAVRDRAHLAFGRELDELAANGPGSVTLHVDAERDGAFLDIEAVVEGAPAGAHLYCCGPAPMLAAYTAATSALDLKTVHLEHFASDIEADTSGGFEIVLQQSGLTLCVEEGKTILQTMLDAGVDVPFSCSEGICGTCETAVLDGVPDHRDLVLTESEKAVNDVIFVCCSGSKSPRLVLDA
jgi:ferredoxin-NADP reductase